MASPGGAALTGPTTVSYTHLDVYKRQQKTWNKTKEGTEKGWDKTKEVSEKGWNATKSGAEKGWDKTKTGAEELKNKVTE